MKLEWIRQSCVKMFSKRFPRVTPHRLCIRVLNSLGKAFMLRLHMLEMLITDKKCVY